jgi:hypothetical protein
MVWRTFRKPAASTRAEDLLHSYWDVTDYRRMNERFVAAMERAGFGPVTAPSTHAGTRFPISGYQRADSFALP